ncbi:MAG: hypothetical protein KOO63_13230 [Bacteroidales bacterium]|nr:hypothetical protein [Candidatus Latescibacterota bacterium]
MTLEQSHTSTVQAGRADSFELLPGMGDPEDFSYTLEGQERARRKEEQFKRNIQIAYVRGMQKGLDEANYWKEKAVRQTYILAVSADEAGKTLSFELEEELIGLVKGMTEKILKFELSNDVLRCLEEQVRSCVKELDRALPLRIRLNPDDVGVLEKIMSIDQDLAERLAEVRMIPDGSIGSGGCVMETDKGALHATIDGQLEKLVEAMENEHGKSDDERVGSTPDNTG